MANLFGLIRPFLGSAFARTSATYGGINVLNSLLPLVLLPILSRTITPSDFGIFAIYTVMLNMFVPFVGLIVSKSILRAHVEKSIDLSAFVFNCLIASAIATAMTLVSAFIFRDLISDLTGFPMAWIWVPIMAGMGQTYLGVSLALAQMDNRPILFGFFRILNSAVIASATIFLVLTSLPNWKAPVLGHFGAMILMIPITLTVLLYERRVKVSIRRDYLRSAFAYGTPLIPHVVLMTSLAMIDRVLLSHFSGLEEAGIYSSAFQVSMVMFLVITSFNQAFIPWLYPRLKKLESDPTGAKRIVRVIYVFIAFLVSASLILGLGAEPFVRVYLSEEFAAAGPLVPYLLFGAAAHGLFVIFSNFQYFYGRTSTLSGITCIAAGISIGLNVLLIPDHGAMGAVWANLIAYGCAFLLSATDMSRRVSLPWFSPFKD